MTIALKNEIKELVRQSVREELMRARVNILPIISIKEQKAIEKLYKRPSHRAVRTVRASI